MQFFRLESGSLVRVSEITGIWRKNGVILFKGGEFYATEQDLDTLENYFIEEGEVFEAGEGE